MAAFTLYEGDWAQNKIHVLPQLDKGRVIDFMMELTPDNDNLDEKEEYILPFNYEDVVLLRDYLSSVINLYEKSGKENEESEE